MIPSQVLLNISEEQRLDPSLRLTITYRENDNVFNADMQSDTRHECATARKVKSALAKVLLAWNGDEEL